MTLAGFPHSDISGSSLVSSSPKLFAAYHVLHRLLAPRHPPCALRSLTFALSLAPASLETDAQTLLSLLLFDFQRPDGQLALPGRTRALLPVEHNGIEPLTSALQKRRSPS